jgi:hypothetical protein
MADPRFELDVLRDLLEEVGVVGRLARGAKTFATAYEAFRSQDRKAYQAALRRLRLLPFCHLVCEWIRIKECVLLCLHLCGPPRPPTRPPNPRTLAEAIVRITSDEKLVRQLAAAVERRDRAAFQRLVKAQRLGPICHLFCHWVCYVRYELICRWVCEPDLVEPPDFIRELQFAGEGMRALLEREEVFEEAVAASDAGDAPRLGAVIEHAGLSQFCLVYCFFFCSWRCVLLCLRLCRRFPLAEIEDPIAEAQAFAKALQRLEQRPDILQRLSLAVGGGDEPAFTAVVEELELHRFCIQLCHWICFLRCRRFCIVICPRDHPWFTHVGDFHIYGDIASATGLTNKAQGGHGGPNFGFFGCLKLRGFCPKYSPAFPGEQMAYRFVVESGGSQTPITGGFVCEVLVGTRYTLWNGNPAALQSVRIRGAGSTSPTPPTPTADPFPPDHYIVPDPQGWITVDANALDDGFNGWLQGFASWVLFPGGNPVPPGLAAGSPVPAADQKNGVDAAIVFQATRVSTIGAVNGGGQPPDYSNDLKKIHINNWPEVNLLDLLQFHSGGGNPCSPLTTDLDIEYTVDHELLADWHLELITAAGVSLTSPPSGPTAALPRGDAGTYHEDISGWPTCSYAVQLHTLRRLTDGLIDDSVKVVQKTFCIGERRKEKV